MIFLSICAIVFIVLSVLLNLLKLISNLLLSRINLAVKKDCKFYSDFITLFVGMIAAYIAVFLTLTIADWIDLGLTEKTLHLATIFISLVYIFNYYLGLKRRIYSIEAQRFEGKPQSKLPAFFIEIKIEKIFRSADAWMVIGIILGFVISTDYWGFFNIDSLFLKLTFGYFLMGLLSVIEFSGQNEPDTKGYLITFFAGLVLWPLFRIYYALAYFRLI